MLEKLTLVIGGAASGKSYYAEGLVTRAHKPRRYIATAQAFDDEMRAKIARHRARRDADWITVDAPLDVVSALQGAAPEEVVLLDCVTLWLSNHLLAEHDLDREISDLLAALTACTAPVVIVTNEVGLSSVPDNALARKFRESQGKLNQMLAAEADRVVAIMAGLPIVLKGTAP